MSAVLCARDGPAEPRPGLLLPLAADRLLRRPRLGARDRLASGGLAGGAPVPGPGPRRGGAGSFDDLPHPAPDRRRGASRRVHVGAGAPVEAHLLRGKTLAVDATT